MKLHLPKQLFTALLTAITLAAAPAALTLGSAAWGVSDADSTAWSGDSDTWYVTDAENALESINATTTSKTSVFIRATRDDVVRTVGTLTLKDADRLTIAGDWDSATAHFDALTIESLVIGSGEQPGRANLTVGAAQTSGSVTPAQEVTIKSITGSVGNLNLGAASTLTLNLNEPVTFVAGSVLTLNDGSDLILNNAGEIEFNSYNAGVGITTTGDSGTVTIGSGTTAKLTNTNQTGVAAIDGIIKVLGGGKLLLAGNKSLLGHSNLNDATNAVYLKGDSDENMATMELATNTAQHLTTNLCLEGYAQITDSTAAGTFAFIECYGGNITATGTQNTIATSLFVNINTTINVIGTNDELTITGRILSDNTGDVLTKSGEGTLTIAGEGLHGVFYNAENGTITESDIRFTFVNSAGTTNINADTAFYKLEVSGGKVNINSDVTVKNTLSAAGSIALDADSTLSLGAGTHSIGTLTGSGALNMSSSDSNASATISKLGGYTGTITVDKAGTGTASLTAVVEAGTLNMAGISVKNGATATIKTRTTNGTTLGSDISLGNVAVGGNSTLTVHFSGNEMRTATLTTLDVNGTAAVVASNYHGQISINSLTSSGDTNALTLTGNTPSDGGRTVFNLKDGAFDGSINFIADANGTRKFALNIEGSSVVQDAVINTSKTSSGGDHHIAIGIGADSVTVKGLTGGAVNSGIYSGSQQFGNPNPNVFTADSSKFRTLIIDTDGSKGLAADATAPSYSTSSSLSSNLNLQKDGAGSQTFTGNLSAFNGTVTINAGTLGFTGTGDLGSGAITIASVAELKLGNSSADAERTLANSISGAGKMTITGANTVKLTSAATHSGGTEVQAGSTLSLTAGGETGALRGTVDVYGTLRFSGGDVTGWGNSADVISTINVHSGGEVNVAVTNNQTAAGLVLNLQGGSLTGVSNSNLDLYYGGGNKYATINALAADGATAESPTVSTISGVQLGIRQNDNIFTVDSNARLEINSSIVDRTNQSKGDSSPVGTPSLAKDGAGEMVLKGTNNFNWFTYVNAGTLTLEGSATLGSNEIHVAEGATFKINTGSAEASATTTLDAVKNAGKLLHTAHAVTTLTEYTATGVGSSIEVTGGTLNITTLNGGAALDVSADALLNITNWNNIATIQVISGSTEDISIGNISLDLANFSLTSIGESEQSRTLDKNDTSQNSTNGFLVTKGKYYLFEGIGLAGKEVTGFGVTQAEQVDGKWYTTVINQTGSVSDVFAVMESATYASAGILGDVGAQIAAEQTLTLDIAEAQTLNAELTGEGAFVKSGDGKLTLGKTISNSGGVTINAGEMVVDSSSKLNVSSVVVKENAILTYTSVGSSETAKVSGTGTLKLATGNRVENIRNIVSGSIGKLLIAGEGTIYEITSSTSQPDYLHKAQQIEVADGATFGDRLTGYTLGSSAINLSIAGDGSGTAGEADAAALALGRECHYGNVVKVGYNVSLADDATIWVADKGIDNAAITGYLNEKLTGAGHTMTKTGAGELVLEKGADNASLHVAAGSLKLRGTTTSEEVTMANGTSLKLDAAATITGKDSSDATMSKVQMSSAGISSAATDSTKGSISNALIDLQKATEFSISDMSLSNVSLKAAATGTELNLNNVTAEAVQLAAGQFTLGGEVALSEQTPATKAGGYTASFTTDQLNGITLNNANGAATLTVDLGELPDCLQDGKTYNITIALSGFSMAAYDGTGLLFAADSWLGKLLADQNAVYVNADDVETATTLAANNNTVTVKYAAMTGGNVGTIITITGLTIPEPTTSTLGLVALAALVTRRRRK